MLLNSVVSETCLPVQLWVSFVSRLLREYDANTEDTFQTGATDVLLRDVATLELDQRRLRLAAKRRECLPV